MADNPDWPRKAYKNDKFLNSKDARGLRILSEYMEPEARFEEFQVRDTVVFFGSARFVSRDEAEKRLKAAQDQDSDVTAAECDLEMSAYYEAARELAGLLTEWSKALEGEDSRFIVCSGGGPGFMEAANRGASEAAGINARLNISLPLEQADNPYITRELNFEFRYFFMCKFWFVYLAKAIIVFPGGFGTHDAGFETLTLVQTGKAQLMPIVMLEAPGSGYWRAWDRYVRRHLLGQDLISPDDLSLYRIAGSPKEAIREFRSFYRIFHSARVIRRRLVIRTTKQLGSAPLGHLSDRYADILGGRPIRHRAAFKEEFDEPEVAELHRLVLDFDMMSYGRLRLLIDELNRLD